MCDITITLSAKEARALVRNGNLMANLGSAFTTGPQIKAGVSDLESALAKLELELLMAGVAR